MPFRFFLKGMIMNAGKTLFAQLMDFLPWSTFSRYVTHYGGDKDIRTLTYADQFRVMAFAQLTYRDSLRDIEASLSVQASKHVGLRSWHRLATCATVPMVSTPVTRNADCPASKMSPAAARPKWPML